MSCHTINYDIVNYGLEKHSFQTCLSRTTFLFANRPKVHKLVLFYPCGCVWKTVLLPARGKIHDLRLDCRAAPLLCGRWEVQFYYFVVVERFGRSDNQIPERGSISSIDRKIRFEKIFSTPGQRSPHPRLNYVASHGLCHRIQILAKKKKPDACVHSEVYWAWTSPDNLIHTGID